MDFLDLIDPIELDREIVREGGLAEFIRLAWPILKPDETLLWNWHIDLVCSHLEAVSRGEIKRLVINIPPGTMKSLLVSVFWQVWEWIERRGTGWMFASFDGSLTLKQAAEARSIIESEWFRERWPEVSYDLTKRDAVGEFSMEGGGYRFSTSVGGKGTGRHVDIQVVDDPIKPKDTKGSSKAISAKLKEVNSWWNETMSSRHKDPRTFRRVIIMQRLHESDLAGTAINTGEYVHVCLPMEFEPDRACVTDWGRDPRTEPGELLWADRFDEGWVRVQKSAAGMGETVYGAQCQQRPAPAGGSIFKTGFRQHWKPGQIDPSRLAFMIQSWDCTFKATDSSDYVAGGVWGMKDADFYMVDGIMARMTLTETCEAILAWRKKWPRAMGILIEDAANGPGVAQTLAKRVSGLILVTPNGGKEARANAVEPLWTGRNIYLPPLTAESKDWLGPMLHQLEFFPYAANDDMVDQMTQALIHLYANDNAAYKAGVEALKGLY